MWFASIRDQAKHATHAVDRLWRHLGLDGMAAGTEDRARRGRSMLEVMKFAKSAEKMEMQLRTQNTTAAVSTSDAI